MNYLSTKDNIQLSSVYGRKMEGGHQGQGGAKV